LNILKDGVHLDPHFPQAGKLSVEQEYIGMHGMKGHDKSSPHLYNIKIVRAYLEYIHKNYPELDIDSIIQEAGFSKSEIHDDGYWFTQEQANHFHDVIDRLTNNPNISREVGRYNTTSTSYGTIRQYIYGFIEPFTAYELLAKIGSKLTKGTDIRITKISSSKVEATFHLNPGVKEKAYQCDNRLGMMEAMAMPFTGQYANVDHVECIHKGAPCCRYIISWNEPIFLKLKRLRNNLLVIGLFICLLSLFLISLHGTAYLSLAMFIGILAFSNYIGVKEKQNILNQLDHQGRIAEQLMAESNRRYSDAELVQELGQAISSILDVNEMLRTAIVTFEKHLDYNRGMILLANPEKTRLMYRAGFGYKPEEIEYIRNTELHLDNPESRGPFVIAFKKQKPYLVNDVYEIMDDLSERSKKLLSLSGAQSFICVPIVYENESLGVLSLDNTRSVGPPKQSDLNLLMGIAPQIAISIINARTFAKMEENEEKYRDLVEGANTIIVRLDSQGRITFANRYAREFYGYTEEEVMGRNILGFIVPEINSQGVDYREGSQLFLEKPENIVTRETETVRKDGTRAWVSWSNKAKQNKDGDVSEILCVGYDITARVLAEEEKKSLETHLVRSQKMEAIGALAGGVAHDLNNILSGITSYPELLLLELPADSPLRKAVLTIKKSGEKAAAIVQDLLTMARRGVNVSNVVNLNSIIREYFESPEFKKIQEYHPYVLFERHCDEQLKCILGSNVHLGKTLMNLISNAAEAIPHGGLVKVSTENRYLEKPLKGYDRVDVGEYAVLSVADTGMGISQEDLKKIFEPFFSKKVMGRSGTGLGMTVVWSTVKDHNGYIDLESIEGRGTRFDLYFPVTEHTIKEKEEKESIENYSGTEKILVVDDSEDQREIAKNFLQKLGYRVEVRKSGEDALAYLGRNEVDLVLLDMIMNPEMDGLDTFVRIREIRSGQKAIIVSGFSETDRVRKALDLGVGSYVRKPYALTELARVIREELDKLSTE
jgi:PAS domain S-box-containing protein